MRCVDWRRAERALDHGGNLIVLDRSRSAGTGLVKQPLDAILQKSPTPLANSVFMDAKLGRNGLARHAVRASQDNPASL